jgi:hypothetical protein
MVRLVKHQVDGRSAKPAISVSIAPASRTIARRCILPKKSYRELMRRLSTAGFKLGFLREAVLPDWWDSRCETDSKLLPDVEFRISRFLGVPLDTLWEGESIRGPTYAEARLRHVKSLRRSRLNAAVHAGIRIAEAANRHLRSSDPPNLPDRDPLVWRQSVLANHTLLDLAAAVNDLWSRGIPPLHVEVLPPPRFQGMACVVEARPVIELGYGHKEPAKLLYHLIHEVAHVALGHCERGAPVVDESDVPDEEELELEADRYAVVALTGTESPPEIRGKDAKALALDAYRTESEQRIDAGFLIWRWANATKDYATAEIALEALYRKHGALSLLRSITEANLRLEDASESDRTLLRCLYGDPERNASSD